MIHRAISYNPLKSRLLGNSASQQLTDFLCGYAEKEYVKQTKADKLCVINPDSSIYF